MHCTSASCHLHRHPWWAVERLFFASLFLALFLSVCPSMTLLFSSLFYLYSVLNLFFHVDSAKAMNHCASPKRGVLLSGRIHSSHRLWAQAPWRLPLLGDFCNDLPGEIGRQRHGALVLVWRGTRRWDHRESAIFTTVHSGDSRISGPKTSLSLSWRKFVASSALFHTHQYGETRMGRPVYEPSSLSSCSREKPSGEMENETIRIDSPWQSKKEQILAEVRAESQKHEFQADSDRRSIQELGGIIESQRREIDHTLAINNFFMNNFWNKIENLVKLMRKVSMRWKNSSDFQGSTFKQFPRRRLIENQDTILELTARIQELQNEVNCMNDSRDFQDAESVRSGLSHVPSQPALLPLFRDLGGMLSRSVGMPSRSDKPPDLWDTHGVPGHVFCKSTGVFFSTLSRRVQSVDFIRNGRHITACDEWKPNTTSGSEMPVRTVSPKFIRP